MPKCTTSASLGAPNEGVSARLGRSASESLAWPTGSAFIWYAVRRGSHMNLPRRAGAPSTAPVNRSMKSSDGPACRLNERSSSTSTAVTVAKLTAGSIPRRTTSTSGSSGTSARGRIARQLRPQLERSHHFGLLLTRPLTRRVHTADRHGRDEHARVIGARTGHVVVGGVEAARGGELLQSGLRVERRSDAIGVFEERLQQPQDQFSRDILTRTEIHGAYYGLERVGENGCLLASAREFLTATEPHERTQVDKRRRLGESHSAH